MRTSRSPRRPHRRRRPDRPVARPVGILAAATPPPAAHRPRRIGARGGGRGAGRPARWSSPAATTGRCGCGTWPPAPRSATRSPATTARCGAVAVAELDGRPVVISGSDDADGAGVGPGHRHPGRRPVHRPRRPGARGGGRGAGRPAGGHLRQRRRDGAGVGPGHRHPGRRPVHRPPRLGAVRWRSRSWTAGRWSVSGSDDGTVRVWDLATGAPVGDPFTGHDGPVRAVAVAELDGRPVVDLRQRRRDGAGMGPGHRRPRSATRSPATTAAVTRGGGRGAGRPPGGHLRQR